MTACCRCTALSGFVAGKGRGYVATRPIAAGTLLLSWKAEAVLFDAEARGSDGYASNDALAECIALRSFMHSIHLSRNHTQFWAWYFCTII